MTPTTTMIERVYGERDNLIPNLKIRSFEYGRTAALIQNLLVATKNRWRSLHFYVTFKLGNKPHKNKTECMGGKIKMASYVEIAEKGHLSIPKRSVEKM